jgi:hypothetical protein
VRADYKHVYLAEESEVIDVLRIAGQDGAMLETFSKKLGGHIGGRGERKYVVVNRDLHYLCLSRDLLHLACFYKDVKDAEEVKASNKLEEPKYRLPEYAHHIYLPERYTEWGSFLKLPVTVHIVKEKLP